MELTQTGNPGIVKATKKIRVLGPRPTLMDRIRGREPATCGFTLEIEGEASPVNIRPGDTIDVTYTLTLTP